jgi:uncharacterized protein
MDYPRYDPNSPLTPLKPAEIDALDRLLQALPADGVMSLDGADGYLTALAIGPQTLLSGMVTAEWLPLVWGGNADTDIDTDRAATHAPFASRRQRKDTVVLLLRHLRFIAAQFADAAGREAWEPIFSIAEHGADEFADARDWCAGFLQAVDLQPGAWGGVWADPLLAPLLHLGGGLEDWPIDAEVAAVDADDPEGCDALSRAVPEAVLHLHAAFHDLG